MIDKVVEKHDYVRMRHIMLHVTHTTMNPGDVNLFDIQKSVQFDIQKSFLVLFDIQKSVQLDSS